MEKNRPVAITIICILGLIGVAAVVVSSISLKEHSLTISLIPLLTGGAIGLACMIGLWKMKKWAIILYSVMFVVNIVIGIAYHSLDLKNLIFPTIVTIVGWVYYGQMD